ncbi:MAG: riboflavin synthase [Candidatus Bipolaricaulia bacterium]
MFTGIIRSLGRVQGRTDHELTVADGDISAELSIGGSAAVNGVCLTAVEVDRDRFRAELSPETLRRTALGDLAVGDRVNLELPMSVDSRFDGHLVLGHIDTVGRILGIQPEGNTHLLSVQVDETFDHYLIEKGSVALDGISLTVFNVRAGRFDIAIIPHTYRNTNLQHRQIGDRVNVEFDVLGKYVVKQLEPYTEHLKLDRKITAGDLMKGRSEHAF